MIYTLFTFFPLSLSLSLSLFTLLFLPSVYISLTFWLCDCLLPDRDMMLYSVEDKQLFVVKVIIVMYS